MGPSLLCGCSEAWSVKKHPNTRDSTNHCPPCHWVVSPANWGTLEATEWALAGVQLWTGQHLKHTHVHMQPHKARSISRLPPYMKMDSPASRWPQAGSRDGLCCFRAISQYHPHIITQSTEARARVIGKDIEMVQGLFCVPLLDVNVCLREWKGQKSLAVVRIVISDIDLPWCKHPFWT